MTKMSCVGVHMCAQVCPGVCGFVWVYIGAPKCAQVCVGTHWCAQVCTGLCGYMWVCDVHGCMWVCVDVCRYVWN